MERVVTINLNGNPYQLEEPAYDALRAYMDRAERALADNPDKAEIVRDLEQAIADKCNGYLSASKSVVSAAEMSTILTEMGPVEGDDGAAEGGADDEDMARPQRRLYRIYDRTAWTGVSAGLAAYAGIDPAWVRAFWVISAVFTGGFTILVYLALIFIMPVASTSEEMAAAHGAPFNAQEVLDRAKREYDRFTDRGGSNWRAQQRAWRRSWREQQQHWRARWNAPYPQEKPVGYVERLFAGLFALVFSLITAALLIAFLFAFFSLLATGQLVGWTPPAGVPLWLAIVLLCITYAAVSSPFSALRRASYATVSGRRDWRGGDDFVTFVIVALVGLFSWLYWPEARDVMEQGYVAIRDFAQYWNANWN